VNKNKDSNFCAWLAFIPMVIVYLAVSILPFVLMVAIALWILRMAGCRG
jgi:hypothetical protein